MITVVVKISMGLQSSKGLTEAEGSTSKIAHSRDYWQEASVCRRLFTGDLTR